MSASMTCVGAAGWPTKTGQSFGPLSTRFLKIASNVLDGMGRPCPCSTPQHLPVRLLAESHQQRLALANRRRAEIAGRAEDVGSERGVVGRGFLHVECDGFLSAAGYDLVIRSRQLERFVAADLAFDDAVVTRFDAMPLQELLSLDAAGSAVAVAEPFDFGGHAEPLRALSPNPSPRRSGNHGSNSSSNG